MYLNFSYFTVFLKNRNISSDIKRSKVTEYAALIIVNNCKQNITSLSLMVGTTVHVNIINKWNTNVLSANFAGGRRAYSGPTLYACWVVIFN